MARIEVDIQSMHNAADQLNHYIEIQKNGVRNIDNIFNNMNKQVSGEEFTIVFANWKEYKEKNSTSNKMLKMLESYVKYLHSCTKNYKIAQENALIRAMKI